MKNSDPKKLDTKRILVIDDEPMVTEVIADMLSPDYTVLTANNGQQALNLLQEHKTFDAIISDIMMPVMDGMTLYESIKKLTPGLENYLIFTTGGVFCKKTRDFFNKNKLSRIEKPFSKSSLRNAIHELSKNNEHQQTLSPLNDSSLLPDSK